MTFPHEYIYISHSNVLTLSEILTNNLPVFHRPKIFCFVPAWHNYPILHLNVLPIIVSLYSPFFVSDSLHLDLYLWTLVGMPDQHLLPACDWHSQTGSGTSSISPSAFLPSNKDRSLWAVIDRI